MLEIAIVESDSERRKTMLTFEVAGLRGSRRSEPSTTSRARLPHSDQIDPQSVGEPDTKSDALSGNVRH
jgi:hypothetical protein